MVDLSSTDLHIPFRASFLKLERASRHVDEFKEVAAAYIASEPATPTLGKTQDGRPTIEGWRLKGVPDALSTIMGDIVHNLRASLDLMASELARRNHESDKDVYFPFAESEDQMGKMIIKRHFDRAGEAAVKLLKEIAPYKGGNVDLRAIHDLDIHDKHRALLIAPGVMPNFKISFGPDGAGGLSTHVETASIVLFMPNNSALSSREVIQTLEELVELTAAIVERFEALV
jgi:hypothetical protein